MYCFANFPLSVMQLHIISAVRSAGVERDSSLVKLISCLPVKLPQGLVTNVSIVDLGYDLETQGSFQSVPSRSKGVRNIRRE
jgi:hypothetical protein